MELVGKEMDLLAADVLSLSLIDYIHIILSNGQHSWFSGLLAWCYQGKGCQIPCKAVVGVSALNSVIWPHRT